MAATQRPRPPQRVAQTAKASGRRRTRVVYPCVLMQPGPLTMHEHLTYDCSS